MKKTKLKVFDFDGTLVDTPLPDEGKLIYRRKTGQEWPHIGWWGEAESLDSDVFEMPVIKHVIDDYQKVKNDPESLCVMLTGRRTILGDLVKKILNDKNLTFDSYHFNTGGATEDVKMRTIEKLLSQNPTIQDVEIWDDRDSHITIFEDWLNSLVNKGVIKKFMINHVVQNRH